MRGICYRHKVIRPLIQWLLGFESNSNKENQINTHKTWDIIKFNYEYQFRILSNYMDILCVCRCFRTCNRSMLKWFEVTQIRQWTESRCFRISYALELLMHDKVFSQHMKNYLLFYHCWKLIELEFHHWW